MRHLNLITPPATEPLTLAEAKLHLALNTDDMDPWLTSAIRAAREYCEHETGRSLVSTTWEETLDAFPCGRLELLRSPLVSVTHVKYYDAADVLRTLDPGQYYALAPTNLPGFLQPKTAWPATYPRPDAVSIRYVAGYAALPERAKHAMKLVLGDWYLHRENQLEMTTSQEIALGVRRLLNQLNYKGFF